MIFEEYTGQTLNTELSVGGIEIIRDQHRQWQGCLVHMRGVQYTIKGVHAYRGNVVARISPTMTRGDELVSLVHPELDKEYPTLGYYNTPTTALYFTRRIARQWKKGAHENNIAVTIPFQSMIQCCQGGSVYCRAGYTRYDQHGLSGVWKDINLFNPTYFSFEASLEVLTDREALSIALNKEIALAIHPANGEIHVLYHGLSVGAVDTNNRQLMIKSGYAWLSDTLEEVINYD